MSPINGQSGKDVFFYHRKLIWQKHIDGEMNTTIYNYLIKFYEFPICLSQFNRYMIKFIKTDNTESKKKKEEETKDLEKTKDDAIENRKEVGTNDGNVKFLSAGIHINPRKGYSHFKKHYDEIARMKQIGLSDVKIYKHLVDKYNTPLSLSSFYKYLKFNHPKPKSVYVQTSSRVDLCY